jgi:biopolymer transport protein ExbD
MNTLTPTHERQLRIDFAPMVDLGFLLITFFIFTTQMQQPQALQLHVPDEGDSTQAPLSSTIHLELNEQGQIHFREGSETNVLASGVVQLYKGHQLRSLLLEKRQRLLQQSGTDEQYTILIQPTSSTQYKELVDVLDEMAICGIKKYVLLDTKP